MPLWSMYTFFYRGTSGIDIDLRRVDINQCPATDEAATAINIFGGTDKCKKETTNVSFFMEKNKPTSFINEFPGTCQHWPREKNKEARNSKNIWPFFSEEWLNALLFEKNLYFCFKRGLLEFFFKNRNTHYI